jgi:phage/plasmid-like protein (TIGR03299 family)
MVAAVETMAYTGAVPWHGLGEKLEIDVSLDEFRRKAGLMWEVTKRPVQFGASNGHGWFEQPPTLSFKDKFVLARSTDDCPYAVVSGRYKPVQPKEIFEFFRDLLALHGMRMHTAGSLMNGARIWALAETGDSAFIKGVDRVDGYLLLSTSYDLTLSTLAQFTSVRVVCNNTLQQALENASGRVTIPHMSDFNPETVKDELGIGHDQWSAFTAALNVMASIKLHSSQASDVLSKVFKIPEDPAIPFADRIHADNVFNLFDQQRFTGADLTGKTAWGLLNATTEYVDHYKRARNNGNRLNSAWFGTGASIKGAALRELMLIAA